MSHPLKKRARISRQISVVALCLISVVALLLSTGLVVFTSDTPGVEDPSSKILPLDDIDEYVITDPFTPLSPPPTGGSLPVLVSCVLIVFAFVSVWFMVFRPNENPGDQSMTTPQEPIEPGFTNS
ncbi:MAG: hypothetical protein FWE59_04290 [Oscillospiraceae bacterium]|nr:hypothetical protein [Oscillospiraceae bacterium]